MKQYVIDELRPEDYKKLKTYLDKEFASSQLDGIYWIPLALECLTPIQKEHKECQPFYFAMDLEESMISCEFLIRTKNTIQCSCMGYATIEQRNWIINFVDNLFQENKIIA